MRRGLGALAALTLGLAVFVSGRPTNDASAATSCVTHTKRVVTHVKRHGKRKRVVRIKHYRTCTPVTAPGATVPAPGAGAPTSAAPAPSAPGGSPTTPPAEPPSTEPPAGEPEPEANALGVAAEDKEGLRYTLSRATVKAGRLTVQLSDRGEDPHTMAMQRLGPDGEPEGAIVAMLETEPGEQKTAPVEVQPGTYKMWCTIGHHAEAGMRATITVE
jgi:plastocyanin